MASIAILGAGVSGKAVFKWAEEQGIPVVIYDRSGADGSQTDFTREDAAKYDLLVYSPGFPPDHPWLSIAREAGLSCLTEPDFAAKFWQKDNGFELTAVTGTNGKTTLTEFLAFAYREAGRSSVAVGNNGVPVTTLLHKETSKIDFPVCEISSFQAEVLEHFSPKTVLWTNFDEDHIDRHGSAENYFRAKFRLVELQAKKGISGLCIVGKSVAEAARRFGISLPDSVRIATREEVYVSIPAESIFNTFPQAENYALAKCYWLANGFPIEALEAAAIKFRPKAHRLARCGVVDAGGTQVEFWNDSKGTNFHAVYAALETFPNLPVYWIGGGLGKGGDLGAFCRCLSSKISAAFLIGETAPGLLKNFSETGTSAQRFETLSDAVGAAFFAASRAGTPRAVVLFSPGFASFDMFKSYAARGKAFEACVNAIRQK